MMYLFAGFTFSSITMHPKWLPDSSNLISQCILFFLVVLFDLYLFFLTRQVAIVVGTYNVSYAPARAKWELVVFNLVFLAVFILWGWSVVLMFLVKNLYFLTLVSGCYLGGSHFHQHSSNVHLAQILRMEHQRGTKI